MPVKILEAEIPPEQYPGMNCAALNTERAGAWPSLVVR
jgi:hypothetical protein